LGGLFFQKLPQQYKGGVRAIIRVRGVPATSLRFHKRADPSAHPIDWKKNAAGTLDCSKYATLSFQIKAVFEDHKQDISGIR